jgi:hypothetical protein
MFNVRSLDQQASWLNGPSNADGYPTGYDCGCVNVNSNGYVRHHLP